MNVKNTPPLNGQGFKRLVEAGMTWLKTNQEIVNNLNVFPVPDGDTGTNMMLTMSAAWKEIANLRERNLSRMANTMAQGALMGARGNSGVILSQIWRGFAHGLGQAEVLTPELLAAAFNSARDTAYKGVGRPVEGTILTVIKETAAAVEAATQAGETDLTRLLEIAVEAADQAVQHTPELLPVLKQAGVVDSGGKGLFFILEGMLRWLRGESLDAPTISVQPLSALSLENTLEAVEEGQDFEVVVDFFPHQELDLAAFYTRLETMGTSIQVGEGDGMYRMHIHVPLEKRYEPIDYIMELGVITKVAMENLVAQMDAIETQQTERLELQAIEPGQVAVVAVSPGRGLSRIFASLGVAAIVEGGQTMNPSTQDLLSAFENLPTNQVIILPNNKNIILAAQQAQEVTVKDVKVVPSRTVPQGLSAMMMYNPQADLDSLEKRMREALGLVVTGEVTIATRTVEIDGVMVESGQVIGLLDGKLVLAAESLEAACQQLLEKADVQEYELVTLYYGADLTNQEANRIADALRTAYPEQEFETLEGGQPHYQFIIAIE